MAVLKNPHVGGQQLPLLQPKSDWKPLAELPDLRRTGQIAVDLETRDDGLAAGRGPGWPYRAGHVCGVAVAWAGGECYLPVAHPDTECHDHDAVGRWLKDHFASCRVVFQNASYDVGWVHAEWGVAPPSQVDDTIVAAVMLDENQASYALDALCAWRGVPGKSEKLLREAAAAYCVDPKKEMWKLPARYVAPYAAQDARATLQLLGSLLPDVALEGATDAYQLECDLIPMVHEMRRRGIRVNLEAAALARDALYAKRDAAYVELTEKLGFRAWTDELARAAWLERAFDSQKVNYPRTPKTGQGSFTTDWMSAHQHWLPQLVVRARKYHDAAHKFIQGYVIDYAHRGRLHAVVNQYRTEEGGGTRSHRFSYADPPLQQMPARDDEIATAVRGAFEPEEGEVWCSADFSQQEFRLIVHFAEALRLDRAVEAADLYRSNPDTDFHQVVMDWTGLERKPAKNTNFAKAFGAGVKEFAAMISKSEDEARDIYNLYDKEMPFVSQLSERCDALAQSRGFVRMIDGARSHFERWGLAARGEKWQPPMRLEAAKAEWPGKRLRRADTRKAMSRLIQGSAARQTKRAMRDCWREGIMPLVQMHDELCFSVAEEATGARVAELMRDAVKLNLPVKVDVEYGKSWGDAKHKWSET